MTIDLFQVVLHFGFQDKQKRFLVALTIAALRSRVLITILGTPFLGLI